MTFKWGFDAEGNVTVIHECKDEVDVFRLPSSVWRVVDGPDGKRIEPSLSCAACGAHTILFDCDLVTTDEIERAWSDRKAKV